MGCLSLLMVACIYGHEQLVELLLSRGATIDLQNESGWTAIIKMNLVADTYGKPHIASVAQLLREHAAASTPLTELSAPAIAPKAAPSAPSDASSAPPDAIFDAVEQNDVATVAAWLDGGGHIDAREREEKKLKSTLLMRASTFGH